MQSRYIDGLLTFCLLAAIGPSADGLSANLGLRRLIHSNGRVQLSEAQRAQRDHVPLDYGKWVKDLNSACVGEDGKWPPPFGKDRNSKMDLVISWWNGEPQPPLNDDGGSEASLVNEDKSMRTVAETSFEHQSEIKYMLRSFEKFGLLDHVRDVVLLIDDYVVKKYGAPRFFDYSSKHIRIVTDKDLGLDNADTTNGKWSKRLLMHKIPGISDYFLYSPDDVLMASKFDPQQLYDDKSGKPIIYDYGDYMEGWCDNKKSFGSGHGPVLVNKCAMGAVADIYKNQGWLEGGATTGQKTVDALCLYSNYMSFSVWIYKTAGDTFRKFFEECHTNGGCHVKTLDNVKETFINVQGDGVGDEYPPNPVEHLAFASYVHDNFPKPSRFEILPGTRTAMPSQEEHSNNLVGLVRKVGATLL